MGIGIDLGRGWHGQAPAGMDMGMAIGRGINRGWHGHGHWHGNGHGPGLTVRSEMYCERNAPPRTAMPVASKWPHVAPRATPTGDCKPQGT